MIFSEAYFVTSFDIEQNQIDSLLTMESDITSLLKFTQSNELTEEKYLKFVDSFVDNSINKSGLLKELRKLINAYQTFNQTKCLEKMERLFIQLLGHSEVNFFYLFLD